MENFDPGNFNSPANFENAGGLSRWVIIAIIVTVVIIVATIVFLVAKRLNQRTRDSGELIADVSRSVVANTSIQQVDKLIDQAIKASADESLLNANVETGEALYTAGEATEGDVLNALVAMEMSKTAVAEKNKKASLEFEKLRSEELAKADMVVAAAVADKARASQVYQELSSDIANQNIRKAEQVLLEVTQKRQAADEEYQRALLMRIQAEKNAKERLDKTVNTKKGMVAAAQKQLEAIKKRMSDARARARELKRNETPPAKPPAPTKPPVKPPANVPNECVFKTREDIGNGVYKCPQGWKDTGLDWVHLWGDAQCMTPKCKNPNPKKTIAKGAKCNPIVRTDRFGDGWRCPRGFMDTGLGHEHVDGDKIQCVQDTCKFPDKVLKNNNANPDNSVLISGKTYTSKLSNKTIAGGAKAWGETWTVPAQFKRAAKLSFEINFAPGFSFDAKDGERGKVGGLKIGEGKSSGCKHSEASSLRLMWERNRTAQAYTYLPESTWRKSQPDFIEKYKWPQCGLGIWDKDFDNIFSETGQWYTVVLGAKLNDIGQRNGKIYMKITGPKNLEREGDGVVWVTSGTKNPFITQIEFLSFFGGGDRMKSVKPSTFQLRNIRIGPY